ncbi:MAG: CvpA family protein [Chitinophagaceae bacterium]|jgi:membrane protein required for colicin V production|nr:CvpA family protein [Chitinophagaceae bacterium]
MIVDIVAMGLLALAIFRGIQKGLIIALFSVLALVLGAAAALKLSGLAAVYLAEALPGMIRWVPALAFVAVFIGVVLLVRMLAGLIESALEWTLLGWANKLGGVLLFVFLYAVLYSIALFYADKMGLVSPTQKDGSFSFGLLQPLAPAIMDTAGHLIPWFKNMFQELEQAFSQIPGASGTPA